MLEVAQFVGNLYFIYPVFTIKKRNFLRFDNIIT